MNIALKPIEIKELLTLDELFIPIVRYKTNQQCADLDHKVVSLERNSLPFIGVHLHFRLHKMIPTNFVIKLVAKTKKMIVTLQPDLRIWYTYIGNWVIVGNVPMKQQSSSNKAIPYRFGRFFSGNPGRIFEWCLRALRLKSC